MRRSVWIKQECSSHKMLAGMLEKKSVIGLALEELKTSENTWVEP